LSNEGGDNPSAAPRSSDLDFVVGRVGRPHGLDGSFYVVDPTPELPATGGMVSGRRIVRRAGTSEKPILRLEGSATRDDALALRGSPLTIPRDEGLLEEGVFWASDLEGCTVVDGDLVVGFVRRMSALPSVEVLEVDRADGAELLVPLVRDCIRSIDLEARRIEIDLSFLGES
jgi:16S rRNA processing protein RimM